MRRAAGLATASVLTIFAAAFVLVGALALAWASRAGAASDGWSQEAISVPSGGAWIHLRDVSCTSTGACIVVGFYSDSSSKVVPLAESWNGSSWSAQTVPVPSGAKRSQLEGISCSSQSACVAVGYYLNSASEEVPLAESWNGSSWSAQTVPVPSGAKRSQLEGVSCSSQSACIAVGGYEPNSAEEVPLAEFRNGSSWSVQSVPKPIRQLSWLERVSCGSASACVALGKERIGGEQPLGAFWGGSSWSLQSVPYAPIDGWWSDDEDVSCSSASTCTSVGGYENYGGKKVPLAGSWNGSSWSVQAASAPNDAQRSWLEGVSCSSASACVAVGSYVNSSGEEVPLAESGSGSSWSVQIPSAPGSVQASWLESVSCSSQSDCIAVGGYEDGSSEYEPLAESWNGSSEQKQETKEPSPPAASGRSGRPGIAVPAREAAVLQGYALVRLRCTGEGACRTPLALIDRMVVRHVVRSHGKRRLVSRVSRIVIGKAWVSIPARGRDVVPIKFSRKGMSLLMHAPRHRLRVVLVGRHVKKGAIVLVLRSSSAGTAGDARNP